MLSHWLLLSNGEFCQGLPRRPLSGEFAGALGTGSSSPTVNFIKVFHDDLRQRKLLVLWHWLLLSNGELLSRSSTTTSSEEVLVLWHWLLHSNGELYQSLPRYPLSEEVAGALALAPSLQRRTLSKSFTVRFVRESCWCSGTGSSSPTVNFYKGLPRRPSLEEVAGALALAPPLQQ